MEQDEYRLRFFFDAGSGTCLWAGNDAARERFGYWIDPDELPLSGECRERLQAIVARYDESIDWDYPPDSPVWSEEDEARFGREARELVEELRGELGSEFEIVDEMKLAPGG